MPSNGSFTTSSAHYSGLPEKVARTIDGGMRLGLLVNARIAEVCQQIDAFARAHPLKQTGAPAS